MAVAAEEHGREILEVYLEAMRGGDWRAAEALMSRIYGKPTETVVTHTPASPAKAVLASMTLDEKLELLQRLQRGETRRCDGHASGRRTCSADRVARPPRERDRRVGVTGSPVPSPRHGDFVDGRRVE
jgi:hypothetical protein